MADPDPSGSHASFPLALRPMPSDGDQEESLISQLARISHQFGQYRHMDEDKLKQMAADQEAGIVTTEDQDEDDDDVDDMKKRVEHIRQVKADMFRHINDAQQEILFTIDFLGLLLSKDSPRGANYLSPALKTSGVPEGSFSYDKWPLKQPDEREKRQRDLVAKGWTMEGLGSSADSLLQAATRLEKEVRKETQYWSQILSITERGWSLRRFPRERGTLGVQFGFSEATDQFKARGFAPLRAKDDGNIILDQALVQKPKAIRVQIVQGGKKLGSSHQNRLLLAPQSDLEIEDLIRRARDSLFEQELFQEMTMETRHLLSHNVRLRDRVIIIPIRSPQADASSDSPQKEVHIDLVGLEDMDETSPDHSQDGLAEDIALALRLLLSHTHSQRLKRRSEPPPPLTDRKRPDLPSPIIRTLLHYIYHYTVTNGLRAYLGGLAKTMSRAGLSFDTTFTPAYASLSTSLTTIPTSSSGSSIPVLDTLLTALSRPLSTSASILPPSPSPQQADDAEQNRINITLRTLVALPTQGTDFSATLPPSLAALLYPADHQPPSQSQSQTPLHTLSFDTLSDLTDFLDHALAVHLAHHVVAPIRPNLRIKTSQGEQQRWPAGLTVLPSERAAEVVVQCAQRDQRGNAVATAESKISTWIDWHKREMGMRWWGDGVGRGGLSERAKALAQKYGFDAAEDEVVVWRMRDAGDDDRQEGGAGNQESRQFVAVVEAFMARSIVSASDGSAAAAADVHMRDPVAVKNENVTR
ncbi:subunit 17 of mediator complex-domain-containing protein [Phyllosticta capitalensis]